MSKIFAYKITINVLVAISFIFVALNIFMIFILMQISDNFSMNTQSYGIIPTVNPVYSDSKSSFKIEKMQNYLAKKEKEKYIKLLIKEYITKRYSVIPNANIMKKNLGIYQNSKNVKESGLLTKYISPVYMMSTVITDKHSFSKYSKYAVFGTDAPTEAWKEMIIKDAPEAIVLMKKNISRSVRIIEEPKKDGDFWITKVQFIYKTSDMYDAKEYSPDTYRIKMEIQFGNKITDELTGKTRTSYFKYLNPVKKAGYKTNIIFNFIVKDIEREEI